ncbi:hypothetical protein [Pseudomonas sp. Z2-11]
MGKKNTASVEPNENGTKERILKTAAKLFSTRTRPGWPSWKRRWMGLGRGALYYHIGSKEELLFEITSRYLRLLIAEGSPLCESNILAEDKFRQFSTIVMRTIVTHLAEMTVCFREMYSVIGTRQTELLDLHRQYERLWSQILKTGVSEGTFRTSDSLAVKAILGIHHYSYLWIKPGGPRSSDSIAMFFCDTILPGLKTTPAQA